MGWKLETLEQLNAKIEQDEAMDKLERAVEEMEAAKLNLERILGGKSNGSEDDFLHKVQAYG